jgi:thioredoxin reductase
MTTNDYEVIIIGGGAAGLSAATVLGRAHRSVLVIDNGKQSNLRSSEAHAVFTRDKTNPKELYRIAREQLSEYSSVVVIEDTVMSSSKQPEGFRVVTANHGSLQTTAVLLAQGMDYVPVDIKGAQELFGTKAWHCPYCEGYEAEGKKILAIYDDIGQAHMSKLLPLWIKDLHFRHPGEVNELINVPEGVLVEMNSGIEEIFDQVAIQTIMQQRDDLYSVLGCSSTQSGRVVIDQFGATSTPGVFAAGDQASDMAQVNLAVASGHTAGVGINMYLLNSLVN